MSLSKILEEIKRVQPDALADAEEGPVETLAGRRGRKNQAVETLKRLTMQYTTNLLNTAAFILVLGDEEKREEFSRLAVENHQCFKSDPNAFYSDLANRVPQELYLGKEGLANTFDILGRHLEDKALELGIIGYPQLIFRQEYRRAIANKEEFTKLVTEAINDQVGGELVGIQAAKSLTKEAIRREHGGRITAIVLPTGDETFTLTIAEYLERLTSKVFVVALGRQTKPLKAYGDVVFVKEVTAETVEATLQSISSKLVK